MHLLPDVVWPARRTADKGVATGDAEIHQSDMLFD
jgi:hypothetical protein